MNETQKMEYGITAYSHPIRSSDGQIKGQSLEQHISDYSISLLMAVVLTFLPASSIIYLIEERKTEQKLVQRTFGVGPLTYWISIFLWDLMTNLVFLSIATIIIYMFQIRSFTANDNLGASVLLMFLFLMASNSLVYIIEKLFSQPSFGQIIVLTTFIFITLTTSIIMLLLTMFWWMVPLQNFKEILEVILLIFPPYALSKTITDVYKKPNEFSTPGGGFLKLTENQIYNDLFEQFADKSDGYGNPYGSDVIGKNLLALGLETVLFLLINFLLEMIIDENPPTDDEGQSENVLGIKNVTKFYKTLSTKFKAVDNLR